MFDTNICQDMFDFLLELCSFLILKSNKGKP